jgi:hypothetical protein
MPGNRRTHKRKYHDTRRQTRRAKFIQRGGADWPKDLPDDFVDKLVENGFSTLSRLKKETPTGTFTNEQIMEDYLRCLERQDEIFEIAMEIIRKKVSDEIGVGANLSDPAVIAANINVINAKKSIVQPYIDAVEALISFVVDTTVTDETKLQEIRSDKTPLSILLLYPAKLRNLLVDALANIFIVFRENKKTLLVGKSTTEILAAQYEAYAQSLAYTLTARPLRDGFFLNQGIEEFKTQIQTDLASKSVDDKNKFWGAFARALYTNKDMTIEEINNLFTHDRSTDDNCTHLTKGEKSTWGQVAADVFTYFELKPDGDILELFSSMCAAEETYEVIEVDSKSIPKYLPNEDFLDVNVRGTTLRKILSNLDDPTLQFILQLSYSIKKAIKAESTPPTTP